jgi:lipopolysaccharide export system protein LptA
MNARRPYLPALMFACLLAGAAPCALAQTPAPAAEPALNAQNTIVTADRLEMKNTGVESHLVFIGNVQLVGTNLTVTCDRVEIYAEQIPDVRDPEKKATIGKIGALTKILALGHVKVSQEGRTATAGRAEVMPIEDKIVLSEEPVVTDTETQVTVSGTRMTFFRGDRYGQIENPQVVGPALPNLGFPREQKPAAEAAAPATAPAPAPAAAAPATPAPTATPAAKTPAKSTSSGTAKPKP